jgi:hypothetical protein
VSICDVNTSSGDTLAQELGQKFNKSVIFCPCDVTDYSQSEGKLFIIYLYIVDQNSGFILSIHALTTLGTFEICHYRKQNLEVCGVTRMKFFHVCERDIIFYCI